MFSYGQVNVTDSAAVEIVAADLEQVTEVTVSFVTVSDGVYFGDSSVSTSTGFRQYQPYLAQDTFQVHLHPGQSLYAIGDSSEGVLVTYLATA